MSACDYITCHDGSVSRFVATALARANIDGWSSSRSLFGAGPVLAVMVAAGVALSGCGSTQSSNTIDGFTLGVLVKCSPPVHVDAAAIDASCAGFPKRAMAALDARDPGHAAIVSTVTYADGTQPGTIDLTGVASPPADATRHPGPNVTVFVFKLADGTTRATGVACSGDPMTCIGVGSYPR